MGLDDELCVQHYSRPKLIPLDFIFQLFSGFPQEGLWHSPAEPAPTPTSPGLRNEPSCIVIDE